MNQSSTGNWFISPGFFKYVDEKKYNAINGLAMDLVYNTNKHIFFDDALKIIPELKLKYKLAIVSDSWPYLKDAYKNKGYIIILILL